MSGKQITIIVVVLVLLALVIGGVVYYRSQNTVDDFDTTSPDTRDDTNTTTNGTDNVAQERLTIIHSYDGTHSYGGSLVAPTPCHTLEADALVAESSPEQISINLTFEAPEEGTACMQVTDRKTFDLDVNASEEAQLVRVMLDGASIPFEVFEEAKG